MKARVAKESELVLWYGFEPDTKRGESFHAVLKELSIPERKIENWMWNRPIFGCLDQSARPPQDFEPILEETREEWILLKGIQGARLDELLQALKAAQVSPIGLKAVVTPYNRSWTFLQLYEELLKEKDAVR